MNQGPDLVVIGVAKAGTTAVARWLDDHPQVAMSRIKEPNFFSADIDPSQFSEAFKKMSPDIDPSYWDQAELPPIHGAFVRDAARYQRLWEHATIGQVKAEASPSYAFSDVAPEALAQSSPDAKVLLILRNPVDRAISHFRMARQYGMVQERFEEALQNDMKAVSGWGRSENFVALSTYAPIIRRWRTHFPNMRIEIYEELFDGRSWNHLSEWLGIDAAPAPQMAVFQGQDPKWPALNKMLFHTHLGQFLQKITPFWLKKSLKRTISTQSQDAYDREAAWRLFQEDVKATESLLGRQLSLWT